MSLIPENMRSEAQESLRRSDRRRRVALAVMGCSDAMLTALESLLGLGDRP
jgi:hypothetical protein